MNANLASIHSSHANTMLSQHNSSKYHDQEVNFWTGLNSLTKRGEYKWSDNTPTDYTNFYVIHSGNHTVTMNPFDQGRCVYFKSILNPSNTTKNLNGLWFKQSCINLFRYVCQKSADPSIEPTPPQKGYCPPDWFQYANQKCIKYVNGSMNFTQAQTQCVRKLNADMLSIHSEEEQNFITAYTAGKLAPYIGFKRLGVYYEFAWNDNTPVDYTNWDVPFSIRKYDHSKRHCATLNTNMTHAGKWNMVFCNETLPVICEMSLDPKIKKPGHDFNQKCNIKGFDDFIQYRNSCYSLIDSDSKKLLNFADAEKSCQSKNGSHLISIIDIFEEAFLRYFIKQNGKSKMFWTGLQSKFDVTNNVSELFEWTDDWPLYYTNWAKNESNSLSSDKCVIIDHSNGTWLTTSCVSNKLAYVCKVTSDLFPKINHDKSGVCPTLKNVTNSSLQWVNFDKRSDYCYWFSADKDKGGKAGIQTWVDASFHCMKRNGTLVSIHSIHDSLILMNKLILGSYDTWIGLSSDPNGNYVWEDRSTVDFTNWDPNEKLVKNISDISVETSRQCVEAKSSDGLWRQYPCSGEKHNHYICGVKKMNRGIHLSTTHLPTTNGLNSKTTLTITENPKTTVNHSIY